MVENKEEGYKIVEVATSTAPAIQTPKGDVLTSEQVLVQILNDLEAIKKVLK